MRVTSRLLQNVLAAVFVGLGGWCVLAPSSVEGLALQARYQHQDVTTHVLIGCFGAQAVLVGLVLHLAELSAEALLTFGLAASLPFFVFNWYFYAVLPMFTPLGLIDVLGNTAILACGVGCYVLKKREAAYQPVP